jgi:hypothetical protein
VWRSKEVLKVFMLLDEYRDRKLAARCAGQKGTLPRIRRRPQHPTDIQVYFSFFGRG